MDLQDGKRMFGDIKSKLGFGKSQDAGYDDAYSDDFDEYAEYGDDYDEYEEYAPAGSSYDRYAPVTTRSATSRTGEPGGMPRLVSIDDVRASTQVPSSLNRDPLQARHVTSSPAAPASSFGRTMVDSSLPPQMTPEGTKAVSAAASRRRSEGLDSLFEPTTGADVAQEEPSRMPAHAAESGAHAASVAQTPARASFEPSTATSISSYSGRRSIEVLKPMSYGEVERVTRALKAGNAVVLGLLNTPEALSKRILDFSFGVASALDATVECIGDKVFAITCGNPLSEVERMNLRNQGVL